MYSTVLHCNLLLHSLAIAVCKRFCISFQINSDCNENIGRVDNELKLLATTKRFLEDDVVSNNCCMLFQTLNAYHLTCQCIDIKMQDDCIFRTLSQNLKY